MRDTIKGTIRKSPISMIRMMRRCSGFTVTELIVAIVFLAVLIAVAFSIYTNYINKAKITLAESTLDNTQKDLANYYTDKGKYPASIDFHLGCIDENSHIVFASRLCNQLKKDLYSVENYSADETSYILTAQAKDTKHTLITLTPDKITKQGD